MSPGIHYLPGPPSERWRITHCVLRQLDAERAELRVCAESPCTSWDATSEEPEFLQRVARVESGALDAGEAPCTWMTVIPVDALPADTRAVLSLAADVYETEELDLDISDELQTMLLALRRTTWTPEPVFSTVH